MRFVYNQLVARWKSGIKYNRKDYQRFCVQMRQSTPWMRLVNARAVYEAADAFHSAVRKFFGTRKAECGAKWGPPAFRKRGCRDGFRFSHRDQFRISGRSVRFRGLGSWISMREKIRFSGSVKSVSISQVAGKWYASFLVEREDSPKLDLSQKPSVGVDFGLKVLAMLSNGEVVENPRPLAQSLNLLRKRQRQVSRKFVNGKRQSNRHAVAVSRVARLHKKIADQRSAAQHAFTSDIVKRFSKITIEDLNVSGMAKNRKLARAISDASWSSLRFQLEYKSRMAGVELVVADRFFASSKTCSGCGHKVESLTLKQRVFSCPECRLSLDRDLNAAINLDRYEPTTRPNRASRKTREVGRRKSASAAGPFDVANISLSLIGGSLPIS